VLSFDENGGLMGILERLVLIGDVDSLRWSLQERRLSLFMVMVEVV
jgi:hypothetical protein